MRVMASTYRDHVVLCGIGHLGIRVLEELCADNKTLGNHLRDVHEVCDEQRDIASASLIENWIDETERRTWFLFDAGRPAAATGH